jgi:hypothetical protein
MSGSAPARVENAAELISCLNDSQFNCLLLYALATENQRHDLELRVLWELLRSHLESFLFGLCNCNSFDPQVSDELFKPVPAAAPIAVAPLSAMTPREAGLFYLKFFTELKLHSAGDITGKMAWFSFSKARELLRRRRYTAKFGIRC